MKKGLFILAVSLILILVLCACSEALEPTSSPATTTAVPKTTTSVPKTTAATSPATTAAPEPTDAAKYGGTFKVLSTLPPNNVGDPALTPQLNDIMYAQAACEFLTTRDNADAKVIPALATSWQASPDNKSITFTLRKGVKFHDGTDFNAEAAKFSLDLAIGGKQNAVSKVSSVEVVDAYTLKVNLNDFDPFILDGDIRIIIVSPDSYKKLGNDAMFHAVGTGPYKFSSYENGVRLTYERFENYWGGRPYLDKLVFEFIANETTMLAAFKAGDGDALVRIEAQPVSVLKPLKFQINTAPTAAWGFIANSKDPNSPFSDLKVRQAFSYSIDAKAIANALSFGEPSWVNQFSARPEIPGTTYNPNVTGYNYDTQKAKQLLTEAGYPNGFNTRIFTLGAQWFLDMCQAVAGYMSEVGIKADIDIGDGARWAKETRSEFSGMAPFFISVNPLENMADQFYWQLGGITADKGGRWPVSYIPSDYLPLVQEVVTVSDVDKKKALFQQMNKMIIDDYCLATPIFVGTSCAAFNPLVVHDFDASILNASYWHPEKVWVTK